MARQTRSCELHRLNFGGLKVPKTAEANRKNGARVVGEVGGLGNPAMEFGNQPYDVEPEAEMRAFVAFGPGLPQRLK